VEMKVVEKKKKKKGKTKEKGTSSLLSLDNELESEFIIFYLKILHKIEMQDQLIKKKYNEHDYNK